MDIYKLLSPFCIFIVMICAFHPDAHSKKHLGGSETFSTEGGQLEKEAAPVPLHNINKREHVLGEAEPSTEKECPKRRRSRSFDEMIKCPKTFCQHVSYSCNIECPDQDTGAGDCELYNCTGTHHCSSTRDHNIPIEEVCDNIDQCPDSDDESTCVRPCWPSCMCIGLMVKYRDTYQDISRSSLKKMFNITNKNDQQTAGFLHLSYLSYLVITDIHTLPESLIKGFNNLKSLDVSNNNLTFLSDDMFSELSSLVSLNLSNNNLTFLSDDMFSELSSLVSLDLSNNDLTFLFDDMFSELPSLLWLNLSSNMINTLSNNVFNGLSYLMFLDLSNNQIIYLPDRVFQGLSALQGLYLELNQIKVLPDTVFNGNSALDNLFISNNQISILPDNVFNGLSKLSFLTLSNNQISILPDNVFNGLSKLSFLALSNNQISILPDNMFNRLAALMYLDLGQNQISVLPDDMLINLPSIFALSLNGNNLLTLPALPFSVVILNIAYNSFTKFHHGSFFNNSKLSLLNIVGNDLDVDQYMFEGLDNLETLLTDNPFMCCVKPRSVSEDRCLKPPASDFNTLFICFGERASCKSEGDAISSCNALVGSIIQKVCLWVIGVCALVGNVSVFFYRLLVDRENMTKSYSLFVLNLSISDFLMGIYLLMIGVADAYYNGVYAWNDKQWRTSIVCTIAGILSTISSEMSTFLILLVTIDRVIVIAFPMSRLSRWNISWKQAIIISVALWFVSVALAVIPVIGPQSYFKGEYYSQSGVCLALPLTSDRQPGSEYSFAIFVCLNSIIFVVIVIGQICILKSLVTSTVRITSSQTRQRDMAVARTLFMVVTSDFCCWFPIGVMGVMSKTGYKIPNDAYAWVMVFVLPVNAAINPFLYTATAIWRKRQRAKGKVEIRKSVRLGKTQAEAAEIESTV